MPMPGSNLPTGPYQSTSNPTPVGTAAPSQMQTLTTQDILDQLGGKVNAGTTNTLAAYGAQSGAGGGSAWIRLAPTPRSCGRWA